MMPTRLQDGMSMPLTRWLMSAEDLDEKIIEIRLLDDFNEDLIAQKIAHCGLQNINRIATKVIRGRINASNLMNLKNLDGISSIVEMPNHLKDTLNKS